MDSKVRDYLVVTLNYWAFTLTDGALRMLVVLHFHTLGYSALEIAFLFLFYEFFGIVTNLVGGYLGARVGLNRTMQIGLLLQIGALLALTVPDAWLTVALVMTAQAVSGIAKDLNKMSAKSSVKGLTADQNVTLYRYVAVLTGSKNALKGVGFFLGALLLGLGFQEAMFVMAGFLLLAFVGSLLFLRKDLGRSKAKPKFSQVFSSSRAINLLSLARFFLFAARDAWFVVALPVYLHQVLGLSYWMVGAYMALWVIFYGIVQANGPRLTGVDHGDLTIGHRLASFGGLLMLTPIVIVLLLPTLEPLWVIAIGLLVFAILFAANSALHSYLIVRFSREDGASLDIGFYYMANAAGRLVGTLISGYGYLVGGIELCLWVSAGLILIATAVGFSVGKGGKETSSSSSAA